MPELGSSVHLHEGVLQGSYTVLELLHLGPDACQLLVGTIKPLVCVSQRCTLWCNNLQTACCSVVSNDWINACVLVMQNHTMLKVAVPCDCCRHKNIGLLCLQSSMARILTMQSTGADKKDSAAASMYCMQQWDACCVTLSANMSYVRIYLVDAEVFADIDHPATETSCSARLVADVVCVEVGVADVVLLTLLHTLHRDIVLVKCQQRFQEGIYIIHHLLSSVPAQVLQIAVHTKHLIRQCLL